MVQLEAALAPSAGAAFGKDAYPDLDAKAAALLHSVARNHALIDGNERLALAAVVAFYGLNGRRRLGQSPPRPDTSRNGPVERRPRRLHPRHRT